MNLTTHNTAIVLDSTADFPDAQIRFPNMRVVPLYVRFGEESFRDYVELDPHDFYTRLRTAPELPTTEIYRASWPFVWLIVLGLIILVNFPGLVTFLPNLTRPQ